MMPTAITIEPMHERYNRQVGYLLMQSFRGKFQPLTRLGEDELVLFFGRLLSCFPDSGTAQRMVALQGGKVIGTLAVKWKTPTKQGDRAKSGIFEYSVRTDMKHYGVWNVIKLMTALLMLNHEPQIGEGYIADVAVHPEHRGKGIGKLMLEWVRQYGHSHPHMDYLSLHVAGSNGGAKRLYEQLSFRMLKEEQSWLRYLFFQERHWEYMILKLKEFI